MLTAVGIDGDLLANWVVASGAFVDALEIIAKHGYIQYWQDTLGITLYSMGEFSVKVCIFWACVWHSERCLWEFTDCVRADLSQSKCSHTTGHRRMA